MAVDMFIWEQAMMAVQRQLELRSRVLAVLLGFQKRSSTACST